ncbi:MAG: hypothetical protein H0X13_04665 [Ramlibacter sp.]|nr:hypothetical protein [Ramlibacter sp.]
MHRLSASILVITVLLLLAGCERAKTRLDREVDRLCAIDGGVHVYETVELSKENFGPDGEVFPQYRGLPLEKGRYSTHYYFRPEEKVLISGTPSLYRFSFAIVRQADRRVMGEQVSYVRRGGDFPGPWHDSSHACSEKELHGHGIESKIFIQKEGK